MRSLALGGRRGRLLIGPRLLVGIDLAHQGRGLSGLLQPTVTSAATTSTHPNRVIRVRVVGPVLVRCCDIWSRLVSLG